MIRLELDVSDVSVRRRLERQWTAVSRLWRRLQHDAATRCQAYSAAYHGRGAEPKGSRGRLGLSRKGIEAAAKAHIEGSRWMRDHLTKATGSWWDFTRIAGRARSHTKAPPVWETYRLVGTLDEHLAAYRHPELAAAVSTGLDASGLPAGTSVLSQPAHLRPLSGPLRRRGPITPGR